MSAGEVVAAAVVPVLLVWLSRAGGLASVKPGELRYSRALRWFGLLLAGVPTLGLVAILLLIRRPLQPDERIGFVSMFLLFGGLGAPLVLEFFGVRHQFDDAGLSFRSPWSRHRRIAWLDVSSIRWRKIAKSLNIKTYGGVTVRISPLVSGLKPFADVALVRIPPAVLGGHPDGRTILQLMSAGAAAELMTSPASPEKLLAAATKRSA
jgi:hypothetical protein